MHARNPPRLAVAAPAGGRARRTWDRIFAATPGNPTRPTLFNVDPGGDARTHALPGRGGLLPAAGDDDGVAAIMEAVRQRLADTAAAAGHQNGIAAGLHRSRSGSWS